MEDLSNIVQLTETLMDDIVSGRFRPMIMIMIPVWSIIFMMRFIRRLFDISADYGTVGSAPSSFVEQVYHEELSQEDIETIETELLTLEEPEPTHREESVAAVPDPTPVHIKMVKCKHCLAPKPKGGTCAYCGLG